MIEEKVDSFLVLNIPLVEKKLDSALFVVAADMPSMPGAHNIKPVKAQNMGMGMYHILLNLEMSLVLFFV